MIPIGSLRSHLRLLLGVRAKPPRRLPRRSSKPRIGTYVVDVRHNLRFVVRAGMSDELWRWLMDQGWRVESYRPDRRQYRDIPVSWVIALIDAEPAFRQEVLGDAMLSSQCRASLVQRPC